MPAKTLAKKSAAKAQPVEKSVAAVITDAQARTDVLNRLKRAEGQLRGIQRMIEDGEDCLKIGQQFSAVRRALESTYMRMTLCYLTQELHQRLSPQAQDVQELDGMLKDMETLLTRLN